MKEHMKVCIILLAISIMSFAKDEDLVGVTISKIVNMVENDLESYKQYLFSLSEDEVLRMANSACKEGTDSYFVGYYLLIPYFGEGLEKRKNDPDFFIEVCKNKDYHIELRTIFATRAIYLAKSWSPAKTEQVIDLALNLWELPDYDNSLKLPMAQALLKYLESKNEFMQPRKDLPAAMNRHVYRVHKEAEKVLAILVDAINSSGRNLDRKDSHYLYDATRMLCQYINWYLEDAQEVPHSTFREMNNARKSLAEMLISTTIAPEIKRKILRYSDDTKLGEFLHRENLKKMKKQDCFSEKWAQDKIDDLVRQSLQNEAEATP